VNPRNGIPVFLSIKTNPAQADISAEVIKEADVLAVGRSSTGSSSVLTKYVFPQSVGPVMFAVNECWKRNSFSTSLVAAVDIHDCLVVCIGDGDGGGGGGGGGGGYVRWFCGYG
jgi:hypothetical protein